MDESLKKTNIQRSQYTGDYILKKVEEVKVDIAELEDALQEIERILDEDSVAYRIIKEELSEKNQEFNKIRNTIFYTEGTI